MPNDDKTTRPYSSPLRERQAGATRELILDALTELLSTHRSDEVSTKEIAARAGVSQPTVYRHFPDRTALIEGLADRMTRIMAANGNGVSLQTLDDLAGNTARSLTLTDAHAVEATAEAILNADPRRLSKGSRARSEELLRVVAESLPEYDERAHLQVTALLRNLYSVQAWLRMREEFGIPGVESGSILAWAIETLVREIRAGHFPAAPEP